MKVNCKDCPYLDRGDEDCPFADCKGCETKDCKDCKE